MSLYLNETGFTQQGTDCECSPTIAESKGNKMSVDCELLFKRIAVITVFLASTFFRGIKWQ